MIPTWRERTLGAFTTQEALMQAEIDDYKTALATAIAQLPEGMKDCTILFKECEKGHGWLTATNWVQHGCPTCALATARASERERCAKVCEENAKNNVNSCITDESNGFIEPSKWSEAMSDGNEEDAKAIRELKDAP